MSKHTEFQYLINSGDMLHPPEPMYIIDGRLSEEVSRDIARIAKAFDHLAIAVDEISEAIAKLGESIARMAADD